MTLSSFTTTIARPGALSISAIAFRANASMREAVSPAADNARVEMIATAAAERKVIRGESSYRYNAARPIG
jgi:hypothetical protein